MALDVAQFAARAVTATLCAGFVKDNIAVTTTAAEMREAQDVVVKRKPGGQPGNRNALKNGRWSTRNRATRSKVGTLKRSVRDVLRLARAAIKAREAELSSPVYGEVDRRAAARR